MHVEASTKVGICTYRTYIRKCQNTCFFLAQRKISLVFWVTVLCICLNT